LEATREVVEHTARAHGCAARVQVTEGEPAVVNDAALAVSGKKMEGDEAERRHRGRHAKKAGHQPAGEQVTFGGSKQRRHLPRSASTQDKQRARQEGKR
jgi:metal-dependent amidase/aminoacylase/carboxypeptidase family protein